MIIHTFPSGLTIDSDNPYITSQYCDEKKKITDYNSLCEFQERWWCLCPTIRKIYKYEKFDELRKSNLAFYTENYIHPGNEGNEWAIAYMELCDPSTLSIIRMFARGSHIHDPEQKFKTDYYDGPDEALTFKLMVEAGRIDFDKEGFVRLYQPYSPYDICQTIYRYNSFLENKKRRKEDEEHRIQRDERRKARSAANQQTTNQ
jgi:hypothetical protein